ncbi:MAG: hypothetical protein IKG87_12170 [Clostridia bacterium]|nr:hypothetical protein [Clostridia bacterium]
MKQEIRKEIYREVEKTARYAWIRVIWWIFMEEPWLQRLSDVGGYIGESTRSEIEYAQMTGKPVRYMEE